MTIQKLYLINHLGSSFSLCNEDSNVKVHYNIYILDHSNIIIHYKIAKRNKDECLIIIAN